MREKKQIVSDDSEVKVDMGSETRTGTPVDILYSPVAYKGHWFLQWLSQLSGPSLYLSLSLVFDTLGYVLLRYRFTYPRVIVDIKRRRLSLHRYD